MNIPNLVIAAGTLLAATTPALAEQRQEPWSDPRLVISYSPDSGVYCIRSRYVDPTLPSGVRSDRTACQSKDRWAAQGVEVSHRVVPAGIASAAR